ncbi:conserved hypothetical protein [Neospora caninum Liverpool]|uniref:Uncharacterized protein n=1 Tax=Neospora caninum (strain Liverpool) TaxID=572307 RepID=F0VK97_NEOCL|nr:conserved hypothetical protein [Neospora caninum Liverpool]CBZ54498.1 conserved hypothetical protein [Neospora caninum Liverpool]CEL69211.1 TPA: hypothetical protein BN1204_049270 [Neospora caninum Liverpool]|eukprot:XP_003884528.1 conserved hypothetical protein [Neospora caninum Liverpool]
MSWFCLRLLPSRKKKGGGDADSEKGSAAGTQANRPAQNASGRSSPRTQLAHGDTTRTLFSATSAIGPAQLQGPGRLASSGTGARLGVVPPTGSPPPRGNLPSAFLRSATEMNVPRGETGRFTPAILSPSAFSTGSQRLPKTVKVVFSRVTDVPANREGDAVEDRTFLCSVYFEDETMTKAVDNPDRVTQPAEGFYSGIKHYEVPLNNESILLQVPSGPGLFGTDPLTGEKKSPPPGFKVALTEQLATGNQIYKGSTQLLRFDDARLTQMSKWPLTNPVFRQGAGFLFLRCELTYGGEGEGEEAAVDNTPLRKAGSAPQPFRSVGAPSAIRSGMGFTSASACPLPPNAPAQPRGTPTSPEPARSASGSTTPYSGSQADLSAAPSQPLAATALPRPPNLPPLRPTPRPLVVAEKPEERLVRKQTMKELSRDSEEFRNGISPADVEKKEEGPEERSDDRAKNRGVDSASTGHPREEEEEEKPRRSQTSPSSSPRRQESERGRKKEKKEKKEDRREKSREDREKEKKDYKREKTREDGENEKKDYKREKTREDGEKEKKDYKREKTREDGEKEKKDYKREKTREDGDKKEKKAKKAKERSGRGDSEERKEKKDSSRSGDSEDAKKKKKKKKESRDNESPRPHHRDRDQGNGSDEEEKGEKKKKKKHDKDVKKEKLTKEKTRSKRFHESGETDRER